jgi:hypothetical protein
MVALVCWWFRGKSKWGTVGAVCTVPDPAWPAMTLEATEANRPN